VASKFAELYKHCQTLKPKISRRDITKKVLELTDQKVKAVKSGLDIAKCRGFFISAKNVAHPLVKQMGTNVIVVARELNYCWERFVYTKELMHLFDVGAELTDSPEQFEKLLTEFGQPSVERPAQNVAEAKAFWMALSCFCPEEFRLELQAQIAKGHMDNYAVALQLRIPEQYVPQLFIPTYPKVIQRLTV
jgi:hypothetical protein